MTSADRITIVTVPMRVILSADSSDTHSVIPTSHQLAHQGLCVVCAEVCSVFLDAHSLASLFTASDLLRQG
jgi:hypothetical protein